MKSFRSKILSQYVALVKFLGQVLGPDYEIALHEISADSQSIIAIANGQVSGRKIGAPITDFALQMMKERVYETHDYILNYKGVSMSGKVLRSSTIFIKDEVGKLIGMLCINFDASRYQNISNQILELCNLQSPIANKTEETSATVADTLPDAVESFPETIDDMIESAMKNCLLDNSMYSDRLTQQEKIQIVDILNKKGVFLLKGAVSQVAKRLRCSEPTIYRYLSTLHHDKK